MRTGFTGEDRIRSYFDFVNPAQIADSAIKQWCLRSRYF